jgi:hypothetical protein
LSFFKRLVPLHADMEVDLESLSVEQGRPFKGNARLTSKEDFNVEESHLEIRVTESWEEPAWERDSNGNERQVMKRNEAVRYSQNVPISQAFEMHNGDLKEFPLEVTIPICSPTRYGGSITYAIKAVANVKGRPDVTKTINPMVVPSTGTATVVQAQVIKIPCKYCGTLVEFTSSSTKCPSCGAPLTIA